MVPDTYRQQRERIIADAVEVTLQAPEDFLKVRETLTRMGIAVEYDQPTLYQTAHILHRQKRYYILHFKELFLLDGRVALTDFTDEDRARRNLIAYLLGQWGLVQIVSPLGHCSPMSAVHILPYAQKSTWRLVAKYQIGRKL